jgi:hypothetical protein
MRVDRHTVYQSPQSLLDPVIAFVGTVWAAVAAVVIFPLLEVVEFR